MKICRAFNSFVWQTHWLTDWQTDFIICKMLLMHWTLYTLRSCQSVQSSNSPLSLNSLIIRTLYTLADNKRVALHRAQLVLASEMVSGFNSQENHDGTLLNKVIASNHTMHHLLPTPKSTCYNLRSVGHDQLTSLNPSEIRKHSLITWYLRTVIKSLKLLTVSFSTVVLLMGFLSTSCSMVFIILSFMRLIWCILHTKK